MVEAEAEVEEEEFGVKQCLPLVKGRNNKLTRYG
jgi:hypothetical protein